MVDLKKLLTKILQSPKVIETGSIRQPVASGSLLYCDWTWKIWSDNSYDLWCVIDGTSWSLTAASGNGYYTSFGLQFPSPFNTKAADFIMVDRRQAVSDNGGNALITFSPSGILSNGANIYIFTTLSFSASFGISVYAHGTL